MEIISWKLKLQPEKKTGFPTLFDCKISKKTNLTDASTNAFRANDCCLGTLSLGLFWLGKCWRLVARAHEQKASGSGVYVYIPGTLNNRFLMDVW